jgi:putative transposase
MQDVAAASPPPVVADERSSPGIRTRRTGWRRCRDAVFEWDSPPGTVALQFGVARLKRLDEVYAEHPVYFVTACTHERRELLARESVLRAVTEYGERGPELGAWLGSFVLMADHLHAFVALDAERCRLSAWVSGLKAVVARALKEDGVKGLYWQKGFFDHVLRGSESASEKWEYVRNNPVRAGLVQRAEDWEFRGQVHLLRSDEVGM